MRILFTLLVFFIVTENVYAQKVKRFVAKGCNTDILMSQPENQTVCEGDTAYFIAFAFQYTDVAFWQKSIDSGNSWTDTAVGINTDTLKIPGVTAAMNNYQYRRVLQKCVNGASQSFYSDAAVLSIGSQPVSIMQQPGNLTLCTSTNSQFKIKAGGNSPAYQWQLSNDGGINFNNVQNGRASALTVTDDASQNNAQYRCIVTGKCGQTFQTIISSAAKLTILNETVPLIIVQPKYTPVCTDSSAVLSTLASGNNVSYQWQRFINGKPVDIAGATNTQITIPYYVDSLNGYRFRCKIASLCPAVYTNETVVQHITTPPSLAWQTWLKNNACNTGDTAVVAVYSNNADTYQWEQSEDGNNFTDIPGALADSYKIVRDDNYYKYYYRCRLSNKCFAVSSDKLKISEDLMNPVNITKQPADTIVDAGTFMALDITTSGAAYSNEWQLSADSGKTFLPANNFYYSDNRNLYIRAGLNNYLYRCAVTDWCGRIVYSQSAKLKVKVYWTGTYDNRWQYEGNWAGDQAPLSSSDVYIPSGLYFYPNIDNIFYCKSLTVSPGAVVNIAPGGNIIITGK